MRIPAYHRPTSLEEAWRLKAQDPASAYIAGGTDVLVRIREGTQRPPALISLRNIPQLRGIEAGPPLVIGALTPVGDLVEDEVVCEQYPVLPLAARRLGSVQIRNLATVGGNLCNASPCADLAPPLLVLDARVRLSGPEGTREIPLQDFFVSPGETRLAAGEVLTGVVVERPSAGSGASFFKKGRVAMDIALASAAVWLELADGRCTRARVAVGSVGPRPLRLPETEAALSGKKIDDAVLEAARSTASVEVQPISDKRATETYRRQVAGVLVKRAAAAAAAAALEEVGR